MEKVKSKDGKNVKKLIKMLKEEPELTLAVMLDECIIEEVNP